MLLLLSVLRFAKPRCYYWCPYGVLRNIDAIIHVRMVLCKTSMLLCVAKNASNGGSSRQNNDSARQNNDSNRQGLIMQNFRNLFAGYSASSLNQSRPSRPPPAKRQTSGFYMSQRKRGHTSSSVWLIVQLKVLRHVVKSSSYSWPVSAERRSCSVLEIMPYK